MPRSPFHAGERLAQARVGVRDRVESIGRHMIRAAMPDQHRELFATLPYLVLGGVDDRARPWASMVAGPPGFVTSPDATTLVIDAAPGPGDPLATALVSGAPIGVLGIELATRRRNRANGVVRARQGDQLTIDVRQSFGNCPKYIHGRAPTQGAPAAISAGATTHGRRLPDPLVARLRAADTFFIASATADAGHGDGSDGVDVSHRGGHPGFVRVDQAATTTLTFPDFLGNFMFNTIGNLLANPRAGLVVPDFRRGDLLSLTGTTEIVWDGPEVEAFAGAERLIRFHVDAAHELPGRLGAAWSEPAPARHLADTGRW